MKPNITKSALVVIVSLVGGADLFPQGGGPFEVHCATIGGGGGTSTGGVFSVTGLIGHAIAGSMSGGIFRIEQDCGDRMTPAVSLDVSWSGPQSLMLAWSAELMDFILEETSDCARPEWSAMAVPFVVSQGQLAIEISATDQARFFRLNRGSFGKVLARRYCGVLRYVSSAAYPKLALASARFQDRARQLSATESFETAAHQEITQHFGAQSPAVTDLLAFYILADGLKDGLPEDPCPCDEEAMNSMSATSFERLRIAVDRQSDYLQTVANIMRKIRVTTSSLLQNLE